MPKFEVEINWSGASVFLLDAPDEDAALQRARELIDGSRVEPNPGSLVGTPIYAVEEP